MFFFFLSSDIFETDRPLALHCSVVGPEVINLNSSVWTNWVGSAVLFATMHVH
jgi:hypothetical protein